MEFNDNMLDCSEFTRTLSDLSLESGVPTSQIHYYLKKNAESLEGHIYKKPGPTNPYMLDDEGYAFMLPILNKVAEKKAEAEAEEPKTLQELYDERILDLKENHEERTADLIKFYEEQIASLKKTHAEQIATLEESHAKQIADNSKHYEEMLQSKDEIIKLKDDYFLNEKQNVERLSIALDNQQKIVAIQMTKSEKESSKEEGNKKGIFSMFSKKQ